MDENNNSAYYNPLGNFTNDQKKTLFTNTRNSVEKKSSADYYTSQNTLGYMPQRSSKLWNHITSKPKQVNPQSNYYTVGEFTKRSTSFDKYKDLSQSQLQEDKSDYNYLDKSIETGSDIFSDNEDKTVTNQLQSVTLSSPVSLKELQVPKVTEELIQTEQFKVEPPFEKKSYAEEKVEKLYETIFDDLKYPEIKHEDLFAETQNVEKQKEKDENLKTIYNAVLNVQKDSLNSVKTENLFNTSSKEKEFNTIGKKEIVPLITSPDKLQQKGLVQQDDSETLPYLAETKESMTGMNLSMDLKGTAWVDNLDEVKKELEETTPQITKLNLKYTETNTNPFDTPTPVKKLDQQKERGSTRTYQSTRENYTRNVDRFTSVYTNDLVAYANFIDYNPFTVFTLNRSTPLTEGELKKLKGVLVSGNIKEEALIKYFTEAMSITNEEMMKQIVDFLLGMMKENHKVRQFVVRLLLCALSIHPEEFISTFKVEYLEALFTPQIDDTTGIYFLRLLLSYKSTFNSISEVTNNIPYSVSAEGRLLYSQETTEENELKKRETSRDGKLETLYILKILMQRSRAESVYELPNTMLREHLCIIWYEMPKTIPKVNIVEILLHWVNSKEGLETKKYPFLLLERIRDMHQFPKGNMLLLSHFFLFTLKHNARVNSNMEYIITMVGADPRESEINHPSQRSSTRSSIPRTSRNSYRTESIKSSQREGVGAHAGMLEGVNKGDILGIVLYNILNHFNENDLIDLWCLICVIPWKVTRPNSPFSKLFATTLTTILKVTSLNYENYNSTFKDNKIRLDILENCMRICLVRCSSPINALNALLQTSLLLNPTPEDTKEFNRVEGVGMRELQENRREYNMVVDCLYKNGMVLNSLCTFLWKCHFLWTRIKEGVNIEVVIVVTELYKVMSNFTTTKPLDINYEFNTHNLSNQIYNFFNNNKTNGVWTKITTFLPQINLEEYFEPRMEKEQEEMYEYMQNGQYYYQDREGLGQKFDRIPEEEGEFEYLVEEPLSEERRTVGLKNLGNSCYLNSLIQALYHTKFFVYNLMLFYEKNMDNEIVTSIVSLFEKMRSTEKRTLKPKKIFKILTDNLSKSQQDVTEAIRFISEAIDPNLELWKSVFAGLVIRRIKCLRCESMSDNEETMYDFSLTLNKAKTVQQMLDNFSKVETLSGENKYFCLNCNKDVKAEMWNVIASPPSHLIIILNRNQWNYNETKKVLKRIKINSELNISGFQYKLYGSIIHSGSTVQSGHYYFIGCDSESFTNWHKIDDSSITSSHEKEIDTISRDSSNTHVPYVLMYRCLQAPQTPKF